MRTGGNTCPCRVLGRKITVHSRQRRGGIAEKETGAVDDTENLQYVGWKVEQEDRLKAVGTWCLLRLEVGHSILDRVGSHNVMEVFHDSRCERRRVIVEE